MTLNIKVGGILLTELCIAVSGQFSSSTLHKELTWQHYFSFFSLEAIDDTFAYLDTCWHVCTQDKCWHVLTHGKSCHMTHVDTLRHRTRVDTCRHVTRPRAPSLRMRGAAVHCDHMSGQILEAQRNSEHCWKSKLSSSSSSSVQKKIFYLSVVAWEELTWRDLRFVLLELLSLAPVLLAALNLAGSNPSMFTWRWSWIEE